MEYDFRGITMEELFKKILYSAHSGEITIRNYHTSEMFNYGRMCKSFQATRLMVDLKK